MESRFTTGNRYRGRSRSRSASPKRDYSRERERDRSYRSKITDDRDDRQRRGDTSRRSRSRSKSRSRSPVRSRRERSRSPGRRDRSKDRIRSKRHRSLSNSRSRSPAASEESSASEDRRRHKKHKDKHRSRRSSRSRERKERKKDKKDKREKKDKKKKKSGAVHASQWGKHGIITETDLYNKEQEFRTWLVEERMINPETITKDQTKKEFAKFVEDFNTATLPHEKYYNIEAFERRMSALRSGEYLPPADDGYNPSEDLKAHASRHKKKEVDHDSYLSKEQLQELRRVQNERIEVGRMKRLGMDVKQTFGVRMEFDA